MLIELIKLVCKKYEQCNEDCPFYDKTYYECAFHGPPASWESESKILERLEENNNE